MKLEGMVHALEKIQYILKPGGVLIDIHPFPEGHYIGAYQAGEQLFSGRVHKNDSEYVLNAENALLSVTERGLFMVENISEFDFVIYAPSVQEISDYWKSQETFDDPPDPLILESENLLYSQVDRILKTVGKGAQAGIKERVRMTAYRSISR